MCIHLLVNQDGTISHTALFKLQDKVKLGTAFNVQLNFKIGGKLRESFHQKTWEKAYNIHDNIFRMILTVELKSAKKIIHKMEFTRKAILFWTRNPKIPYRIWISIVEEQTPFYPETVEEAKSLLFDINKIIELDSNSFNLGINKLFADIGVSWGKHDYTKPTRVYSKSNSIELFFIE